MTAEIAILNRQAVALAADSAVTVGAGPGKVYNTANKLFSLSKYEPIAAMIYGSGQCCTVPWETILKDYRGHLGKTAFGTVEEYYADFIDHLTRNTLLFTPPLQEACVADTAALIVDAIKSRAEDGLLHTHAYKNITDNRVSVHMSRLAGDLIDKYNSMADADCHAFTSYRSLRRRYDQTIRDAIDSSLGHTSISKAAYNRLIQLTVLKLIKDDFGQGGNPLESGLVVTGFGRNQYFPSLLRADFQGAFADAPKWKHQEEVSIDSNLNAAILPFAQREMVNLFMDGVDKRYWSLVSTFLGQLQTNLPGEIVDAIRQHAGTVFSDQQYAAMEQSIAKTIEENNDRLGQKAQSIRQRYFVDPVVSTVGVLPKDELAEMAQTLVNLTSFRRRVTPVEETVGEPIDVAVISKGDGLIWINRKHYFRPELNTQFFATYYSGAREGSEAN